MRLLVSLFLVLSVITSCTRCITCSVSDSQENVISTQESCGTKADLEDAKSRAKTKAIGIGGTYSCD